MNPSEKIGAALSKIANEELKDMLNQHLSQGNWRVLGTTVAGALPGAAIGAGSALFSKAPDKRKTALKRAIVGGLLTGLPAGAYSLGMNRGEAGGYIAGALGI